MASKSLHPTPPFSLSPRNWFKVLLGGLGLHLYISALPPRLSSTLPIAPRVSPRTFLVFGLLCHQTASNSITSDRGGSIGGAINFGPCRSPFKGETCRFKGVFGDIFPSPFALRFPHTQRVCGIPHTHEKFCVVHDVIDVY